MRKSAFLFLALISFFVSSESKAYNIRKCLLLPITDRAEGAMGFKVFTILEEYLKSSEWCFYRHNSEIMSILENYQKKLGDHLRQKDVLKTIADRTKVGSLIRVHLGHQMEKTEVELTVLGDNGEDIYFQERLLLNNQEPQAIAGTVRNWLQIYEKTIPYDGLITGILGDQFTVDFGRESSLAVGTPLIVKRPKQKKSHPLLKEVVEWEATEVARAKVINVSDAMARAMITQKTPEDKIQNGDWVRVDKRAALPPPVESRFNDTNEKDLGRLGVISLGLNIGSDEFIANYNQKNVFEGHHYGLSGTGEIWITRAIPLKAEIERDFMTLKAKTAGTTDRTIRPTVSTFEFAAGYRYLPLGFFFGPRVEGWIGYRRFTITPPKNSGEGLVEMGWKGISTALQGSVPLGQLYRVQAKLELLPFVATESPETTYGGEKSSKALLLEIGGQYLYNPQLAFDLGLQLRSLSAQFDRGEVSYQTTNLRAGMSFSY